MFETNWDTIGRRARSVGHSAKGIYQTLFTKSAGHAAGKKFVLEGLGVAKGMHPLSRGLGFAGLGFSVMAGWQEEGAWGAAKGAGEYMAFDYALGRAAHALGLTSGTAGAVLLGGAAIGAAGFSAYAYSQGTTPWKMASRSKVHKHMKKRAILEMSNPVYDPYGTTATMRQRSIAAMRQSKITARSALGMEGNRRYVPYFRG